MFKSLSAGQIYALATLAVVGTIVCFVAILDTVVLVSTGHDSTALTVLLRFVVGLLGASGTASAFAIIKFMKETNGSNNVT